MKQSKHNLFSNIPTNLPQEVFEELLSNDKLKIERIISRGHTTPKDYWYDQDQHEWILLVQGEALLAFASDEPVHLRTGDYLCIPAHVRHRVDWTPPDVDTIWLAIHYK